MSMKKLAMQVAVPLLMVGLTGCEWGKPSAGEYWSSTYNWVNFSGTYKSSSGGALVQAAATAAAGTNSVTTTVDAESVATEATGQRAYSGNLAHFPVVKGTLQIYNTEFTFNDDGSGNLTSTELGSNATGRINYESGAWSIDTGGSFLPTPGNAIYARYQYSTSSTSGGESSDAIKIYTLTVTQTGNLIDIIDNNGSEYSGKLGSVEGTNGRSAGETPINGDVVIAQFKVDGHDNASGRDVEIVGSFQGTVKQNGTLYYLTSRSIQGTWMESGGQTLDISGVAGSIALTTTNAISTNGPFKVSM